MLLLYNIFIFLYGAALRLAAFWNTKAARWVQGRKGVLRKLRHDVAPGTPLIWMHCASAGEFEQGKPLIEALKKKYADHKVLVTFYSPSGYLAGKKYKEADFISFLPEDNWSNAREFMSITSPSLAIFVKYDFWYYHLRAASRMQVPILLVSSIFREQQAFFKWYGGLNRKMLSFFTRLFVQDAGSADLLKSIDIHNVTVAGDTRFDRVATIAAATKEFPILEAFAKNEKVLVAGSTWPDDEKLLTGNADKYCKMVVAPHEIREKHIEELVKKFSSAVPYSQADPATAGSYRVLIIDNYGMLSSLYRYATVAYIGGGFNKSGIHNTLEAAVWGCPVIFGPNYKKFREARELVASKAAFSVSSSKELENIIRDLLVNEEKLETTSSSARDYVKKNTGAVEKIMRYIQEKRLFTT